MLQAMDDEVGLCGGKGEEAGLVGGEGGLGLGGDEVGAGEVEHPLDGVKGHWGPDAVPLLLSGGPDYHLGSGERGRRRGGVLRVRSGFHHSGAVNRVGDEEKAKEKERKKEWKVG